MANLVNLTDFDREFRAAHSELQRIRTWRKSGPDVWSAKQAEQFDKLLDVAMHLVNAMAAVVHNNRDGRG